MVTEAYKNRARSKCRKAVMDGILVRPETCERCLKTPGPAKDGRTQIHAHHHDYDKPLDVEFICAKCHRDETPLPAVMGAPVFGEKNGAARLTWEAAEAIRNSPLGCIRLGRIYGVDKKTIQRIRNGLRWPAAAAPKLAGD